MLQLNRATHAQTIRRQRHGKCINHTVDPQDAGNVPADRVRRVGCDTEDNLRHSLDGGIWLRAYRNDGDQCARVIEKDAKRRW